MSGVYCASQGNTRSLCQGYTAQVKVALVHYVRCVLRKSKVEVAIGHYVRGILRKSR
jgi:hypothetical protein